MKYVYAILLYLSMFIAVGAGAYVLIFNSPEFLISEMLPSIIVAGAGLVLAIVLLALMKISYAPDARVYSKIGFVSGVVGLIIQAVMRQFYSIHGVLFFFEYVDLIIFSGIDLFFFILLAVTAAVNGYVILLSLCEYTTNRSHFLSEYNTPVALLAIPAAALGLATAFSSVALLLPVFMAVWRFMHTAYYGDREKDEKEKKIAIISPIVTVVLAVILFITPLDFGRGRFVFEYEDIDDKYCQITVSGASGGVKELTIPSEEDGKKVGSVKFAEGFEDLEYLYIPATVFEVNTFAEKMPNLKAIEVEEGNEYFKTIDGALYDILGQKLRALPSTVTEYTVPDGVTSIAEGLNKTTIKRIIYNDDITNAQSHSECTALEYVSLGEGVTRIPALMFNNCSVLQTVEIRGVVTEIAPYAFHGCSALTELPLKEGLLTVGEHAFAYCKALKSVTLPSTLKALPDFAFEYCYNLSEINLGGVTSFLNNTFNATAIKTLHLPADFKGKITRFFVFPECFEGFTVDEANKKFLAYDGVLYENENNYPLYYKPASKTELNLYDGCDAINYNYEDVTKLKLGSAFNSTGGLKTKFPNLLEITFGSNLKYFNAEDMPSSLAYVSIEGHKYLEAENGVLFDCNYNGPISGSVYIPPKMTNVILPDKLEKIGGAIKTIKVDDDMNGYGTTGDRRLFLGIKVESLTVGASLRQLDLKSESSFGSVKNDEKHYSQISGSGLKKLVFRGSDTKIGDWSFAGCKELSEVIFEAEDPNGSMTFGIGAFYECDNLKLEVLPDWLTEVHRHAFAGTLGTRFSFGERLVVLENSAMPDNCEWVSMRGDNEVLYNMNGIIASNKEITLVIPRRIKRVIFTPSRFDLPKVLDANLFEGISYYTELEYVELSEGATFNTPVLDGAIYLRNNNGYSVIAPPKLKELVVPKLDMPLYFDVYSSRYAFDKITLGEGVTDFKLVKGSLYTADGKTLLATGSHTDEMIYLSDEMTSYYGNVYQAFIPSLHFSENETLVFGRSLTKEQTNKILSSLSKLDCTTKAFVYSYDEPTEAYENIEVYLYSEAKPKPTDTVKYWHYDGNGNAVIWVAE